MSQTDKLLELSVLSYHRLSPRQVAVKRFDNHGGTLGRAESADWHLPDPERVVSGTHAKISFSDNAFWITDNSTNGLFVNRAVTAIGQGNRHQLANDDLLCLGDYEIKVAIVSATSSLSVNTTSPAASEITSGYSQPSATIEPISAAQGLTVSQFPLTDNNNVAPSTPYDGADYAETDVLAGNDMLTESFSPPQSLIPDDWQPQWQQAAIPEQPVNLATSGNQHEHVQHEHVATTGEQTNADQCLQAFLQALNVATPAASQLQNPAWWAQLGEALQASLQGVIDVMRSRSEMKNNLRVNQTTFQQRENNPLKFSASVNEAFHNLFNHNASSFMAPKQAISASFADISHHEAAIVAGAAGAMQGLLAQLDPQLLQQRDFGSNFIDKVNPAQRYSRYWSLYQALHQELLTEVARTTKGGVNDDFIQAYENYLTNRK